MKLEIQGSSIVGPNVTFKAKYAVLDSRLVNDFVIVIYDYMAFDQRAPAKNLFCYRKDGAEVWRARDIGAGAADAYTSVVSEEPLWIANFAGYRCHIDMATGEVLEGKLRSDAVGSGTTGGWRFRRPAMTGHWRTAASWEVARPTQVR
jgi:hypothetical protein